MAFEALLVSFNVDEDSMLKPKFGGWKKLIAGTIHGGLNTAEMKITAMHTPDAISRHENTAEEDQQRCRGICRDGGLVFVLVELVIPFEILVSIFCQFVGPRLPASYYFLLFCSLFSRQRNAWLCKKLRGCKQTSWVVVSLLKNRRSDLPKTTSCSSMHLQITNRHTHDPQTITSPNGTQKWHPSAPPAKTIIM